MEPYKPGFTLVDVPDAAQGDLVQLLVHDALRRHPGKVLVYDAAHAFAPDAFAATNRRRGRPEAEFADRCFVQRCITQDFLVSTAGGIRRRSRTRH